jgi:PAS domain S-box-containing protein
MAVSTLLAVVSSLWDWSDVVLDGEDVESDEWLGMGASLWLPVVVATMYRLVRVYRALAATAQEAVEAFQDTVHTAHGWVWRIDADYRIVYSSEGIRALLGYEPDEVVGRHAVDLLVPEEDRAAVTADVQASLTQNGWRDWQTRVTHRDGTIRYVRSSATPVHGSSGRLVAYRGYTADVNAAAAEQAQQRELRETRRRIEQMLRDPDAVHTVLQPIVDVRRQRITGMEALSRFSAEPYRTPDLWFGEAWQAGLGPDLELHAIARAFEWLPRIPRDAYLSINASPLTIVDVRFAALVAGLGPDACRVVVEVTEHAAVNDYDTLSVAVQHLRRTGVRLAVDDAGAGYSSMQHVLRLRPDIIKLDRGIVADIDRDVARRALVTAMAGFAASLDMVIVAEGVENAEELAVLTEAGVRNAQGFFLARPSTDPSPAVSARVSLSVG